MKYKTARTRRKKSRDNERSRDAEERKQHFVWGVPGTPESPHPAFQHDMRQLPELAGHARVSLC